jgi:hypothetical protein
VRDELACPFCGADLADVAPPMPPDEVLVRPAPKYGMPPTRKAGCAVGLAAVGAAVAYYLLK